MTPNPEKFHEIRGCFGCITGMILLLLMVVGIVALADKWQARNDPPTGSIGDPQRGRIAVASDGCTSCHVIPGADPRGLVGPSLEHFGARAYIAGRFSNSPITLEEWLKHPQRMKPGTAMTEVAMTDRDARDIAAYLEKLK